MLELININYEIDNKKILKDINLKINDNEFIAVTGPNGSGKTTLAKIIMGIIKPTSGKIIYKGLDITNYDIPERAKLGITFTFQNPVKFKGMSVRDLFLISRGYYYNDLIGRKILKKVGLCAREYLNRKLDNTLSGGELKRIEIALALAKGGDITIFDEPEAGIDLWALSDLLDVFKDLKRKRNATYIVISHQEIIFDIVDKIIVMSNGKIKLFDNRDKIINQLKVKNCSKCMEVCNE